MGAWYDRGHIEEEVFERKHYPENQISWGTKVIYNNRNLEETTGGEDVKIAVLDTGTDIEHPDVSKNIGQCVDFTRTSITTNTCDDKNGHGTYVSGIISANGAEDGLGIFGVAPESQIWAYKVCNKDGFCWADDVAKAIIYAVEEEANIITLGFGNEGDFLVSGAIDFAQENNVLLIASAGNNGPEEGTQRRNLFTVNYLLTIQELV